MTHSRWPFGAEASRSTRDRPFRAGRAATVRTVLAALLTGAAAGLCGVLLILLLHLVQHVAFGYTEETFLIGVEKASALRRVLALAIGGVIVGVGWWIHRRVVRVSVSVTHAVRSESAHMAIAPVASDGILQIIAVGAGASLGREGAPREIGAALGARIGRWLRVSGEDRRLLLAAGAGAGLAAVYNVPLSGTVFALEALLLTLQPRAVLVSALSSSTAAGVAWAFYGDKPTYHLRHLDLPPHLVAASLLIGPISALAALLFRAAMTRARTNAANGWTSVVAIPAAFVAIGIAAIGYPQILGNGKSLAQALFTGPTTFGLAAVLAVAKPWATWLCLRSGAIGGLLTPAFATGAALGAVLGHAWSPSAPAPASAAFALMGATAFLAIAQRIPITAGFLALELTHLGSAALVPVELALLSACITASAVRRCAGRWTHQRSTSA